MFVLLMEDIKKTLDHARLVAQQVGRGDGGREMSLCITNLQQAQMWLAESYKVMSADEEVKK